MLHLKVWFWTPEVFLYCPSTKPGLVKDLSVERTRLHHVFCILESNSTRGLRGVTYAYSVLVVSVISCPESKYGGQLVSSKT